jgi:hypothetical protein
MTYNIKDLYINTPITETVHITEFFLTLDNTNITTQTNLIKQLHTIFMQNYFEN